MKLRAINLLPSLPLLTKELIEMAARKRTYILRMIAAAFMFLIALAVLGDWLRYEDNLLGAGGDVVNVIVWCLFPAIYLYLPAVMCPAIASEREAGTLTLIMITAMSPWEIILQKLVGRLVPVFSLVLLALPLLGVAYSLGGVNDSVIWDSAYAMLVAAVQVGCITLMWSSFCRSPAGAFALTYVTLALLNIAWPILIALGNGTEAAAFIFSPPFTLFFTSFVGFGGNIDMIGMTVGCGLTAVASLLLARAFLVSRQHVRKRNALRQVVHAVDRTFSPTSSQTARSLPTNRPVAWSELHRRALGRLRYLVIILVGVELPVLFIALLILADYLGSGYRSSQIEGISIFMMFLWPLCTIGLTMIAAGLFATERTRQTLDVLLTTPMRTRRIVAEKLAGVSRMRIVLAAPIVTLVVIEALYEWGRVDDPTAFIYLSLSLVAIAVYFWSFTWVAMAIGLRTRSARRAVMTAVGVITFLCLGPLLLGGLIAGLFNLDDLGKIIAQASPIPFVFLLEANDLDELVPPIIAVVLHLGLWVGIGALSRVFVMARADALLGRVAAPGEGV